MSFGSHRRAMGARSRVIDEPLVVGGHAFIATPLTTAVVRKSRERIARFANVEAHRRHGMFRSICAATLLLAFGLAVAGAQTPTDFSGRWTLDAPAPSPAPQGQAAAGAQPAPRPDMGTGWGSPISIAQDAKQISIEYVQFSRYDLQPPLRLVYALDGSESTNSVMLGHTAQVQSSRATWDGQALVIATRHTFIDPASGKPMPHEVTHRLSLESPTTLVVEVRRAGVLGGEASVVKKTYRNRPEKGSGLFNDSAYFDWRRTLDASDPANAAPEQNLLKLAHRLQVLVHSRAIAPADRRNVK
jgi:hypothetical protein